MVEPSSTPCSGTAPAGAPDSAGAADSPDGASDGGGAADSPPAGLVVLVLEPHAPRMRIAATNMADKRRCLAIVLLLLKRRNAWRKSTQPDKPTRGNRVRTIVCAQSRPLCSATEMGGPHDGREAGCQPLEPGQRLA